MSIYIRIQSKPLQRLIKEKQNSILWMIDKGGGRGVVVLAHLYVGSMSEAGG